MTRIYQHLRIAPPFSSPLKRGGDLPVQAGRGGVLAVFFFLVPFVAVAQTEIKNIKLYEPSKGMTVNFTTLANKISDVANSVIPFLIGVAIALVIFGIFKYVSAAGDTEKVAAGRTAIIWGIIAVFLMLAFWGLVIAIHNSVFGT